MNGPHDMGGMHGFGPIPIEENEPVFHTEWEAKALALTIAMAAWRRWNLDASRFAREKLPAPDYVQFSYYERWIGGLVNLMAETGLVTAEELKTGRPDKGSEKETPPLQSDQVASVLARGGPVERDVAATPVFAAGATVQTRNTHPTGHTRLPRYARGRTGTIVRHHGAHVLPDSNAHGNGEAPEHLYAVRFTARELWGTDAAPGDSVTLDLWESYLEPADA